jgi:hypothetical protein
VEELGLKEGDQLNVVATRNGVIEVKPGEIGVAGHWTEWPRATGRFPKTIVSIGARPTSGERLVMVNTPLRIPFKLPAKTNAISNIFP